MDAIEIDEKVFTDFRDKFQSIKEEIHRIIVGQEEIITEVLVCLLCSGHALIEGVPGLGKTSLIKALGEALCLNSSRIQFTPDLMPSDILGTNVLLREESSGTNTIVFQKGPVFTQILLADEINRATPKTQSALLEAMQETSVTVGGLRYALDKPFIVLATQNPIEMEGTYPLPEAQMDRFFFKLVVPFPGTEDLHRIVERTTGEDLPSLSPKLSQEEILSYQKLIRSVPLAGPVRDYAVRIALATHPGKDGPAYKKYIRYGSSPRGPQSLVLAGKVFALLDGRVNVGFDDIRRAAKPALRHRMILSFEGEAEGITTDDIIDKILSGTEEKG